MQVEKVRYLVSDLLLSAYQMQMTELELYCLVPWLVGCVQ